MGEKSNIEWTDSSWSAVRAKVKPDAGLIASRNGYTSLVQIATKMQGRVGPHCEHSSEGCSRCYSETNNGRCLTQNGTGLPFDRRARDLVDIFLDEKILLQPLHWKRGRRVFVCSQTDLFGEFVTDEMIERVFGVMRLCPQHTFLVLTKRADRMYEWFKKYSNKNHCVEVVGIGTGNVRSALWIDPLDNVQVGVSVENQEWADKRVPWLIKTPAAVRWLSIEPQIGEIDLFTPAWSIIQGNIGWIVQGGESGHGARPFDVDWARTAIKQCAIAKIPLFLKQLGAKPISTGYRQLHYDWGAGIGREARFTYLDERDPKYWRIHLQDKKGGDMAEWAKHLRVREYPR